MDTNGFIKFEDMHEYRSSTAFTGVNEEPLLVREMIKNRHVRRAGGICSAGEVALFSILPVVREELILVDHSYMSMHNAMIKFLLLRHLGWKETKRLLSTRTANDKLKDAISEIRELLPQKVRDSWASTPIVTGYGREVHYDVTRHWEAVPDSLLRRVAQKLNRVKFVHGDLSDLAAFGPFDLVYLSNALEHSSRARREPVWSEIRPLVKNRGFFIGCGGAYGIRAGDTPWRDVVIKQGRFWRYWLRQVEEAEVTALSAGHPVPTTIAA